MTEKEIETIREFVNRYDEIHMQTDLMQKSIESLAEKRDRLFDELLEMKEREKEFMDELINKYGASEVTPNKLLKLI